jgi:hypothetical protein
MKGIIFNEFLEFAEENFGFEIANSIIEPDKFQSKGIYSSVGTYDFLELKKMIENLSKTVKVKQDKLLKDFGEYMSMVFHKNYSTFFERANSLFDFLFSLENIIHVEVKKLYPDANLPSFEYLEKTNNRMILIYNSDKRLFDLAWGLINGVSMIYNEKIIISMEMIETDGTKVKFIIDKIDG